MKFSFFESSHKVHKQRNVMRNTDERLVKYSRFNVLFNVVIFSFVIYISQLYITKPTLTIILSVGLIITTILRSYILFRFNKLYPRAPSRWRNIYFWCSLLGAAWWGIILAAIMIADGLNGPLALMWLYTFGVFSSCASVFSPYQRFYSTYMLVCVTPSVVASLFSFNLLTMAYGFILAVFLLFLQQQGRRLGNAYWDHLQLKYELNIRTNALEAEKMTSQSTSENKNTLVSNITQELKASLREIISSLTLLKSSKLADQDLQLVKLAENKSQQQMNMLQNTLELANISNNHILLDQDVIDLRACIENSVTGVSSYVYQKQLELFIQFSPSFPLRVRADYKRIQQIITNILNVAANYANRGSVFIHILDQRPINDTLTEFSCEVVLDHPVRNAEIEQELYDSFEPHYAKDLVKSLNLAISRGLAKCMGGDAGVRYTTEGELKFWFTFHSEIITPQSQSQGNLKLTDNRVLLFQPPELIRSEYVSALEAWGMEVDIAQTTDEAVALLQDASDQQLPHAIILLCTRIDDVSGIASSRQFAEHTNKLNMCTPQILCLTEEQKKLPTVDTLLKQFPHISVLKKPVVYKKLRNRFRELLIGENTHAEKDTKDFLQGKKILLFQHEEINITIAKVMLGKLGCEVTVERDPNDVLALLEKEKFDALLTESTINNIEISDFVNQAKQSNQQRHEDQYVLPIIGLNSHEKESNTEKAQCLQNGINYYVDMPLQIDDLAAILRRFIGRAEHMAENAKAKAS